MNLVIISMNFIFENNQLRTNAKGNRMQIRNTTKLFDKLSNEGYTIVSNCFETQEVDSKLYKLTQDGKDLLTAKKGRLRTTRETNKNYAKMCEKYTLVRLPNTHVTVKNTINGDFITNRKGNAKFRIGSPTLTRLLQKNILVAPVTFNSDDQNEKKAEPIAHSTFNSDNQNEKKADESDNKEEEESEYETDEEAPHTFEEAEITTDKDKLKKLVQSCYVAYLEKRDLITFKLKNPEGDIKYYSMQMFPLLEQGKWNMKKAIRQISYFMQYPQYYKSIWSNRDAELYADAKIIGRDQVAYESDGYISYDVFEAMEIDLGRMIGDVDFDNEYEQAMLDMYDDNDELGLGNLFGGDDDIDNRAPYEIAGFDSFGDYLDSFGCSNSLDNKEPDLKTRCMNVMKQINDEKKTDNCFREALDHHGLESKTTGLVSINDILNELNDLKVNYIIYNPILNILEKDYIKSHLGDRRVRLPQKSTPNAPKVLHREIKVEPIVEYQCHDYEGKVYLFALFQGRDTGHIYVPEIMDFYTNASQSIIYQIATHQRRRYMKKITSVVNKRKSNYIYYDIESNETTNDRKFKCNSVSILRYSCEHDLYKLEESKLVEMLKNSFDANGSSLFVDDKSSNKVNDQKKTQRQSMSKCYLQRGDKDSKEDIERRQSENLIIVDEIDLWSIILKEMDPDAQNYIVSFNGACFDNLFLLKSIIDNKVLCNTSICGGLIEISSASTSKMPPFRTLDIRRLLGGIGSLEGHSRSFIKDVSMRKVCNKKLFKIINEKYRNGYVLDDDEFINEFIGYNNLDVESLLLIHCAMLRALTQITKDEKIESILSTCVSLAQFSMIWFKKGIKSMSQDNRPQKFANVGKMQDLTEEDQKLQYDLLKTYKTGGRCQAQKTQVLESKFDQCSLDVASLYPFVMMCYNKGYYMAGELKSTDVYVEGKQGVYFGTVTQVNNGNNEMGFFCNKSIIANDWDVFGNTISRVVMTSHDIEEILKKKPHWQYTISFGYYTDNSARGIDIFASILPFMKEKAVQDALVINKDPSANTAVREMCKSVMNSLSGKFLQAVRQVEKFVLNPDAIELLQQNGDMTTVESVRKEDDEYRIESLKKDKMLHVGLFIYSLSKIYMYQNAYSIVDDSSFSDNQKKTDHKQTQTVIGKNQFVYTDTDSNKIVKQEVFDDWMELRGTRSMSNQVWPECLEMNLGYTHDTTYFYNGEPGTIKCMGQFEDEYKGKGYNNAIYLNKKEYMVWKTVDGKITNSCIKLKGVQCTKLKILNKEDKDIGRCTSENKLFTINYVIGRDEYLGIEEGYERGIHLNGHWECLINQNIYNGDDYWWNENNRLTEEIEAIEHEKATDHDAYVKKFIYIMQRKWRGKKTLVLIKNFKRSIDQQEVRNSFMIKRI